MPPEAAEPFRRPEVAAYSALLVDSFRRLTGRDLVPGLVGPALAEALFRLPDPIVAHGTEADPVFCYANATALALWELDWARFTRLPSRHSAEADPAIQGDRSRLLAAALEKGWIDDYEGIRISATGQRFRIARTVLWNVVDRDGVRHGQAALIGSWHML
ncbi:MEKHLA domain-containing protein [Defluviimonas salinarum]|uniref:MEKHLA domain-containing protein n=1 Tax=Defluviimonas salinarum TaxID=2992147 RepID=A0ABT3J9I8_9RHOB|nr:MEKHLA domain-containing protein [Defluviimonas salinarum]MCW3784358.1 MEKHLA domain-containing protein [Defluviimonas salinarum]